MDAATQDRIRPGALLQHALALLEAPERWARGQLAADIHGEPVKPWDRAAARWDSLGALLRAWSELGSPDDDGPFRAAADSLRRAAKAGARDSGLLLWEDDPSRRHTDVLAALRRAILVAGTRA